MADIKESREFCKALGFIGGNVHEAFKDGPDAGDFKSLLDIGKEYKMIVEGFKGMSNFKAELSDLDQVELVSLFGELISAFENGKK